MKIRSGKNIIIFANATDIGRVRKKNEDYYSDFKIKNGHVFLVCDGVGGSKGGEYASRMAADAIQKYLQNNNEDNINSLIEKAFYFANKEIIVQTQIYTELKGMATTCVILIIYNNKIYYANIGDSRLYYYSNNFLKRLTKDDSFVQLLVDIGELEEKEIARHPRSNEITNALGMKNMKKPNVCDFPIDASAGDYFILCTDGLYGMIYDEDMVSVINETIDVYEKVDKLIKKANEKGGFDNITLQILSVCN